ncbi:MAG: hypothetical protein J7599_24255 [Niabella sp.]|nr:hypothetical protein [Niabella sp.]
MKNVSPCLLERTLQKQHSGIMYSQPDEDHQKVQDVLLADITIQAQEKERNRISMGLHDSLGQLLSAAKLVLQACMHRTTDTDTLMFLVKANGILQESTAELRNICQNLSPRSIHENGLQIALYELKRDIESSTEVAMKVDINLEQQYLPKLVELDIFRICQELVSNALKHGKASVIRVSLRSLRDAVMLKFSDNGKGFEQGESHAGQGLKNIKIRVTSHKGSFKFKSIPFKRTEAIVLIPIK